MVLEAWDTGVKRKHVSMQFSIVEGVRVYSSEGPADFLYKYLMQAVVAPGCTLAEWLGRAREVVAAKPEAWRRLWQPFTDGAEEKLKLAAKKHAHARDDISEMTWALFLIKHELNSTQEVMRAARMEAGMQVDVPLLDAEKTATDLQRHMQNGLEAYNAWVTEKYLKGTERKR